MAGKTGTLEFLAQQIGVALQPLESQLTPDNILPFLSRLGLQFPPLLTAQSSFMNAVNAGSTAAGALPPLLAQLANDVQSDNEAGILQDGLQLIQQISKVVTALEEVGSELSSIAGSLGIDTAEVTAFAASLAENLLSYLLISYLVGISPGAVGVLNAVGILEYLPDPGNPLDPTHPPFVTEKLQLANFGKLLSSPLDFLQTLYGWGSPTFDGTLLLPRLNASLNLLGFTSPGSPGPERTASLVARWPQSRRILLPRPRAYWRECNMKSPLAST